LADKELRKIAIEGLLGALELGYDHVSGGIVYMLDILNMPLMDATVTAENKLWWPMSEALYATVLAYEHTNDAVRIFQKLHIKFIFKAFYNWLVKLWDCIEDKFIDKVNGGDWYGYLRKDCTIFSLLKVFF